MAGLAVALVFVPGAAQASTTSELQRGLDKIHAAGMPGVFAVGQNGTAREPAASGAGDVNTGRPVQPHYRHRVGSITKTFVATVMLQLSAEGRVDLDAPIGRYLPEFAVDGVTVRMLLNHTSGIGNFTDTIESPEDVLRLQHTTVRPEELARLGLSLPRTGEPGASWSYSNTGYILAGLIIEKVTGRPAAFEIYWRVIFRAGLWHTRLPGTDPRIYGPHSAAYIPWPPAGELRDLSEFNMSWAWMAGEMVSTPDDLNRFYRALLGGKLLRPAQLAEMKTTVDMVPGAPEAGAYGLGLMTVPLPCGVSVWGHTGGVFGHTTYSMHGEQGGKQLSLALNMSHYQTGPVDPIADATIDTIFGYFCGQQPGLRSTAPALSVPNLDRNGLALAS